MSRGIPSLESVVAEALPKSASILVAVSGGADSVALLCALHHLSLRSALRLKIAVGHVNHKLRRSSDADERFVKALAKKLGVKCFVVKLRNPPKSDVEAWARANRYQALERMRVKSGARWVATAHHRNDVAETFLIKLLQNRESALIAEHDRKRKLLRPLLRVDRKQIHEYLTASGVRWREDESNADDSYARNWVRLRLIPFLIERWGDSVVRTLTERASAQQRDRVLADALVKGAFENLKGISSTPVSLLAERLRSLPGGAEGVFGAELYRRLLAGRAGARSEVGVHHGASISKLIKAEMRAVPLPGGWHLTVEGDRLKLRSKAKL
jgi:tRNA(Ile)-lysidine synthase